MMSRGVIEKLLSGAGAHTWAPSGPRVIIEERAESDQSQHGIVSDVTRNGTTYT